MAGTEAEELEGIKQVLDGTTTGTPILNLVTQLTNVVTQLTTVNTNLGTLATRLATGNGSLSTIATELGNIDNTLLVQDASIDAITAQAVLSVAELVNIVTELGSLSISVTDSGTAQALEGQSQSRPPAEAPDILSRNMRSASRAAQNPLIPDTGS